MLYDVPLVNAERLLCSCTSLSEKRCPEQSRDCRDRASCSRICCLYFRIMNPVCRRSCPIYNKKLGLANHRSEEQQQMGHTSFEGESGLSQGRHF